MLESINEKLKQSIEEKLHIPYEQFDSLDFDEQERLIKAYQRRQKKLKSPYSRVMIGSGDTALFLKVQKGKRVMIGSEEDTIFIRAGETIEEREERLEQRLDEIAYGKPKAFLNKIKRKIKKK